jgi:hypothetical protein
MQLNQELKLKKKKFKKKEEEEEKKDSPFDPQIL